MQVVVTYRQIAKMKASVSFRVLAGNEPGVEISRGDLGIGNAGPRRVGDLSFDNAGWILSGEAQSETSQRQKSEEVNL